MTKKKARKTLCCQGCSGQLTLNEAATSETLTAYMRAAGHGDYNGAWCDKCRPPASPDEKAAVRLAQQPKPDPGNPWQREGSLHELRLDWESYSGDRHKHLCDRYPNWATIDYFGRKVLGRKKWTQETWNELEKWLIATGHARTATRRNSSPRRGWRNCYGRRPAEVKRVSRQSTIRLCYRPWRQTTHRGLSHETGSSCSGTRRKGPTRTTNRSRFGRSGTR